MVSGWNNFVQARLHFKPLDHYQLFSYQKMNGHMAARFKFQMIYNYEFQTFIAVDLPHDQRTFIYLSLNLYLDEFTSMISAWNLKFVTLLSFLDFDTNLT